MVQWVKAPTAVAQVTAEAWVRSPAPWVKGSGIAMHCSIDLKRGVDRALLWP